MARFFRWLALLVTIALISGAGTGFWGYSEFIKPGRLNTDTVVVIPRGIGIDGIANILADKNVISNPLIMRFAVRTIMKEKSLQAGEFLFPKSVSPRAVINILQEGKTVVRRLTVAEGLTTSEVINRLFNTEGLSGDVRVKAGEGTLLPETYHFSFGDSRNEIILRMQAAMEAAFDDLWKRRASNLPYNTPHDAVIMASIIEKETGQADERARVAGVFVNRLAKGMRLQSDPTVVYGITEGRGPLGRPLSRKDLGSPHPYNTYIHKGLPPGPIANPGRASIEAALNPASTGDLYFVADGKGGHAFARTLAEHNKNVAQWRRIERKRRAEPKSR